jgi:hypothetical protein
MLAGFPFGNTCGQPLRPGVNHLLIDAEQGLRRLEFRVLIDVAAASPRSSRFDGDRLFSRPPVGRQRNAVREVGAEAERC